MSTYYFAFVRDSGAWDICRDFEADNDTGAMSAAEDIAREDFDGRSDWYVLDLNKQNINA